jgi:hypothetical protein
MAAGNVNDLEDDRLFRTVTALGAELRRQDAWSSGDIDLIDLAYAAIGASGHQDKPIELRAKVSSLSRVLEKIHIRGVR